MGVSCPSWACSPAARSAGSCGEEQPGQQLSCHRSILPWDFGPNSGPRTDSCKEVAFLPPSPGPGPCSCWTPAASPLPLCVPTGGEKHLQDLPPHQGNLEQRPWPAVEDSPWTSMWTVPAEKFQTLVCGHWVGTRGVLSGQPLLGPRGLQERYWKQGWLTSQGCTQAPNSPSTQDCLNRWPRAPTAEELCGRLTSPQPSLHGWQVELRVQDIPVVPGKQGHSGVLCSGLPGLHAQPGRRTDPLVPQPPCTAPRQHHHPPPPPAPLTTNLKGQQGALDMAGPLPWPSL
ncbi:hypothetical protein H1C71_041857 [Ictidomys tridecemlineatus]|nr:hypothetical protein H1C71_041857 [Ictidomys tridecemlineatus]